jgi:hypothetical protein
MMFRNYLFEGSSLSGRDSNSIGVRRWTPKGLERGASFADHPKRALELISSEGLSALGHAGQFFGTEAGLFAGADLCDVAVRCIKVQCGDKNGFAG